jgi:hypothetical protein
MAKPKMEEIIDPIPVEFLVKELNEERFVRKTNYGNNEIYIVTHKNSPNVVTEIGRLRELSFRQAGGGTGKSIDIDDYDISENPYNQLVVWEPDKKEIIGGYRFLTFAHIPKSELKNAKLATAGLFNFSEEFVNNYLPYSIELGRSFVQPEYQARNAGRKAVFALDNLWDGLGAIVIENPSKKYFFGKITMYENFDSFARDLIHYFFFKYFKDDQGLMHPKMPVGFSNDINTLAKVFTGNSYELDYRILSKKVRERNENIPPLFNSYMNLSPTMKVFGTAINYGFGDVEETGILITIDDIYPSKKHRHIATYTKKGVSSE